MESDGEATSNVDVRLLRDFLGISVYLDVNEDGSLVLDVFGETMEGSWQATDASTLSATLDGQPVDVTLSATSSPLHRMAPRSPSSRSTLPTGSTTLQGSPSSRAARALTSRA